MFTFMAKSTQIRLDQDPVGQTYGQHNTELSFLPSRFPTVCANERVFREPPPGHPARLLAAAGVLGQRRPHAKPQMVPRRPTAQSGEFVRSLGMS